MLKHFRIFINLLILFIFIFGTFSFADDLSNDESITNDKQVIDECLSTDIPVLSSNIAPTINSRSAIVLDRNSLTILYGKNEFGKVKMASTTKIMTALVVIENASLKDVVTVSKKAAGTRRL